MSILEVANLSVSFRHKVVLEDVSFSLNEGEYLSLIGPNGAGKSTLIRTLLGDNQSYSGSFTFDRGLKSKGYLPQQNNDGVFFPATAIEVIKSGFASTSRLPYLSAEEKQRLLETLSLLNLEGLADSSFYTLSGGQKRSVLLARAFCASSQLLILDEPTAGLDAVAVSRFYEDLKILHEKRHTAILLVGHDLDNVLKESEKVLYLKRKVRFFGRSEDFLNDSLYKGIREEML